MARNLKPKNKQLRRFGLMEGGKESVLSKKSLHGQRLEEKQRIKFLYGIMEKQFRNYIEAAQNAPGNATENLIRLLERRLDNVVYRAGLAMTRPHARQLVNHGHIFVNGRKVNIPSFQTDANQAISIEREIFDDENYKRSIGDRENLQIPTWLVVNANTINILRLPTSSDPHEQADMNMIFESYR